jgi:hypothetical protein
VRKRQRGRYQCGPLSPTLDERLWDEWRTTLLSLVVVVEEVKVVEEAAQSAEKTQVGEKM